MLITLSHHAAICQSVAEVQLTSVAPLGAVSHRFNFFKNKIYNFYNIRVKCQTYFCTFSMSNSVSSVILPNRLCKNFVILYNCIVRRSDRNQIAAADRPLCDQNNATLCNTSRLSTRCGQISLPAATDCVLCARALKVYTLLTYCDLAKVQRELNLLQYR